MDPALSVSLHFSLEFVGVAVYGGLLAWAAAVRLRPLAVVLAALLAVQIVHAGQFVDSPAGLSAVAWTSVAAAAAAAILHRARDDPRLWWAAWSVMVASRAVLAALGPHTGVSGAADFNPVLHAVFALGAFGIGVWTARRTFASVRLRILGAFVLVLFVVVLAAAGPLTGVFAARFRDEQLARLRVQAQAQQRVFRAAAAEVVARGTIVADAVARVLESQGDLPGALESVRESVFPDLGLLAVFGTDRSTLAQSGLRPEEAVPVSGSPAVTLALRGETAPSIERVSDALLLLGASPVYRIDRPRTAENLVAALALARRTDAAALEATSRATGLDVVLVSPSRGEVIAASSRRFRSLEIPPDALRAVAEGRTWRGAVQAGDDHYFAALAPIVREDSSVPAAVVFATPDTALARTTVSISRTLSVAFLGTAAVAILLALLLARRISRPLLDLATVARRVGAGDLDARSSVRSPDEIGTLAGAFDAMATSLQDTIATEQETRTRLATIVDGMGEGLVAIDPGYRVTQINPAAERILGISAADAVGKICHEVYGRRTRGSDGRAICDSMCPLRTDGGADGNVAYRSGPRRRAVAVTCSVLRDPEGNVVGGVDLFRDVSAQAEAERMKTNFLANISHELRTPLTPIRGYAEILRRHQLPRQQQVQYLTEIVGSTDRLERIIKILVDVAAMEAGRLAMSPVALKPSTLVNEAAGRWRERIGKRRVRTDVDGDLPAVLADEGLIGRVLDELIDNAVKFSPDGGAVTLGAEPERGGVRIHVSDRGIGVSQENMQRLFEEFVQLDASETRRFGGLGVGLAFARRVVEGHRSQLEVTSKAGQGSRFSFVLPSAPKRRTPRKRAVR